MSVCCFLTKVLLGYAPQYLSQMKSDLHKTFSVFQDRSELIDNVCVYTVCENVLATLILMTICRILEYVSRKY